MAGKAGNSGWDCFLRILILTLPMSPCSAQNWAYAQCLLFLSLCINISMTEILVTLCDQLVIFKNNKFYVTLLPNLLGMQSIHTVIGRHHNKGVASSLGLEATCRDVAEHTKEVRLIS